MIHKLFKYLNSQLIDYAIINGYNTLFEETTEGDVDMLFKAKTFSKIEVILKEFCDEEDFKIIQIYHQEVYAKNIFILDFNTNELLNLDVYGKLHRKESVFFTETEIFNNLSSYKEVNILAPNQEFFHYLIKKIDKNDVSNTTYEYLKTLYLSNKETCDKTVDENFKTLSTLITEAFTKDKKELIINNIKTLKGDIIVNSKPHINAFIKDKLRVLKRILKPTGIAIAFLGPDGSGKSTVINGLLKTELPFRKINYFHLKPIKIKNIEEDTITTDPHKYKPYSKVKSYFKLFYFIFQYNKGWIVNIFSLKVKSTLIIFDRYYDDLIVDNKRYRYGGSKRIAKLVCLFIPQPELYFILTADAEIIHNRKQEVELQELKSQIVQYNDLVDEKKYHKINVNNTPKAIVDEVCVLIMKKMNERY